MLTSPPTEVLGARNERILESYFQEPKPVSERPLLRAPQIGIRIETTYVTERLKPLLDTTFRPCAILCTIWGERDRLHGLPLAGDIDRLDIFLGPGSVADPDG